MHSPRPLRLTTAALSLLVLGAVAPLASAQLELPKPKQEQPKKAEGERENTARRLLELGNAPKTAPPTMSRRTVQVTRPSAKQEQKNGGVQLPRKRRGRGGSQPSTGEPERPAAPEAAPARPTSGAGAAPVDLGSAVFVYDEVRKLRRHDDPVARRAVDTLLALGERGLAASRLELADPESAPVVVVAARVLLRGGRAEDAEQVVMRLDTRVPAKAAVPLVDSLVELDPVRATPRLLGRLLDHSMAPIRQAAARNLERQLTIDDIEVLREPLSSERKDTRLHAIDLLAKLRDPVAFDWLIERIDDPVAKVARRALEAVVYSEDPRTVDVLLERAFGTRWVLRSESYALLGLSMIEDRDFRPILDESHVGVLSRGMAGSDPFVSGACAAALAGIGFRSKDIEATAWLDDEVPSILVAIVSGETFFGDYSSLSGVAQSRLTLISGASFGADGPSWAAWWIETRANFRASRAVLQVGDGDEALMQIAYEASAGGESPFQLIGPGCDLAAVERDRGEVFYLTSTEAYDLARVLRDEGLFDASRLPGPRGGELAQGRRLEVRVGPQAKSFLFGRGVREDWFERAVAAVRAVEERNLWQRFPDLAKSQTRHDFWLQEKGFWELSDDPRQRAERMGDLVMRHASARPAQERGPAIDALERLYAEPKNHSEEDLEPLLELLAGETYYSDRARSLARLARQAIGLDEAEHAPLSEDSFAVLGGSRLLYTLIDHFGIAAGEDVAAVLRGMGPAPTRLRARDESPLVRAVCAEVLGSFGGPEDVAVLLELMRDPDQDVVATAALVAGHNRIAEAQPALTVLATSAGADVRAEAMRALGMLGGEGAQTVLLDGLQEVEPELRVAAAEGLASLEDPSLAPLFVSLMRKGRRSPTMEAARDGLLRLGEEAHPDLMRALRSPSPELQREAALILSQQLVPASASVLMRVLSENGEDSQVARELAILTCVDHREAGDPASEWWIWWDDVKHDDALAWLRAATVRMGLVPPEPDEFAGAGSLEAVSFLMACMRREEDWLVERARRELERMTGRSLGEPPARGPERDAWLETLYEAITSSRD